MNEAGKFLILSLVVLTGILLYLLAPVLTPFLAAAILAYLADPLVDRLEALRLPRTLAVSIVFISLTVLAVVALLILLPLLQRQFLLVAHKLPAWIDALRSGLLPWLQANFGIGPELLDLETLKSSLQQHWRDAGTVAARLLASLSRSGLAITAWLVNLLLIGVVTFYLLRDWDRLVAAVRGLLPRRWEPLVVQLARESDEVLGAFLRGQLLVMLALAMFYSAGLMWIGLELGLLIGLLAGLVSFVPYLGFIIGIAAAGLAALLQFQELLPLAYVALVFGLGQLLEGTVLTPWLVGDRIGLHPVAVIFAVLAGGQLFGFLGVLLALPVAAVIAVLLRYLHARYQASDLYAVGPGE